MHCVIYIESGLKVERQFEPDFALLIVDSFESMPEMKFDFGLLEMMLEFEFENKLKNVFTFELRFNLKLGLKLKLTYLNRSLTLQVIRVENLFSVLLSTLSLILN